MASKWSSSLTEIPDGDAVGSCLAWMHYLTAKGHKVNIVLLSEYPLNFTWMPRIEEIVIFDIHPERAKELLDVASMIFCLDFNSLDRIDKMAESVRNHKTHKVMIDHHIDPEPFVDYLFQMINPVPPAS